MSEIDHEQLMDKIASKDILLIDVRETEEIQAKGKIPVSVNIPLGKLKESLEMSEEKFLAEYDRTKPKKEDENIVLHCQSGRRGAKAVELAHNMGYKGAVHYAEGFTGWLKHQ